MAGLAATFIDADSFSVVGDLTSSFIVGRRVKADCGVDGFKYGTVLSSSYTSFTTVNLTTASDNLTANLTEAWFGIVGADDNTQSMPDHSHDGSEGSGGFNGIWTNGNDLEVRNMIDGGNVELRGFNLSSQEKLIFVGDPDAGATMYHAGLGVLSTKSNGITVYDGGPNGVSIYMSGANNWYQNLVTNSTFTFYGKNLAGDGSANFATFNWNTGCKLSHQGTIVFETTTTGVNVDGLKINSSTVEADDILDEDDMTSDSATALVTQQSVKAYVDQKDAWSGVNLFDNAAMQVSTRNFPQNMEAFSMAGADRWFFDVRGKAEHKAEQGVIQPNISEDEYAGNIDEDWGCFNLQIGVNTPGGTLQAPDYAMFGQRIPKSKLIPLMQNDFTISFYMRSSLTGTFCLSLRNAGASSENLADYYHSINHDSQVELGGSFYNSLGQTIRTDSLNRGTLTKATFYLRKVLSPTGTAIAELYEVDENEYTSLPTGSAVATSGTFDVSTLTTSFAEIDFTFTDNYEFIPNKFYAIVVTYTGGDGTNYVEVGTDISGTHNGQFVRESAGWSSDATRVCVFYYYETSIAPDRYYIAEFDINSSLTWEYKEINIPKIDPSIGTWGLGLASNIGDAGDNDELGLIIGICQYAGTGWNGGTADAWTTGNQIATTNQIYTSDQTSGRQIRFYQPKLEIGDVATPFYIQSHDEQHAIAMRHYQTFRTIGTEILCMGETLTTTTSRFVLPLIAKRGIPSLSLGKINDSADAGYDVITQGGTYAVSKIDVYSATRNTIVLDVTHATVPAANFVAYLAGDGSARQIDIDALI